MTRSEMRLALLTSVMTWRPQLDAAGVQAEADVLWGWVDQPVPPALPAVRPPVETVAGVPAVADRPEDVGLALVERRTVAPAAIAPPVPAAASLPPTDRVPESDGREETLHAALLDAIDDLNRRKVRFSQGDLAAHVRASSYWVRIALKKLAHRGEILCVGDRGSWRCTTARSGAAPQPTVQDDRRDRLLQVLTVAAEAGAPCPTDEGLATAVGYAGRESVIAALRSLAAADLIRIEKPKAEGSTPIRRIRIVATGAVTGWTQPASRSFVLTASLTKLLDALTAAADVGAPCPSNDELRVACGYSDLAGVSRAVSVLAGQKLIAVELQDRPTRRRRVTIVATGKTTGWTAAMPHRFGQKQKEPTAPCAPTDGPSSAAAPVSRSEPAPTTPVPAAPGPAPSPAASSAPSPASPPASAAPSSPPAAASAPVAAAEPPAARLAAGPVPTPAPRRAPLPPPPPKARPTLRPDEQAAIEAAVAAGLVKVVPTGATGVTMRNQRGEVMEVPPPFPDAPAWAREAAVYLQKRNVQVVTNGTGKWLLDGRWSVTDVELVERANKKRAHQKLPPIEIPADAVRKKSGRAA